MRPIFGRGVWKNFFRAFEGKIAYADQPFRSQRRDDFAQVLIAHGKKRLSLVRRQFVRRAVATARFHERERAVVQNKM